MTKPTTTRTPFSIVVPPEWLEVVRQSARDVDMTATSFMVCVIAEAMRKGQASALAVDGAERNPNWVTRARRPPSAWTKVLGKNGEVMYAYQGHTLWRKNVGDDGGPRGWYLSGPSMTSIFMAKSRSEAEELALGRIHHIGNNDRKE